MTFETFLKQHPLYQNFQKQEESWNNGTTLFSTQKRVSPAFWNTLIMEEANNTFIPIHYFQSFLQEIDLKEELTQFIEDYLFFVATQKEYSFIQVCKYVQMTRSIRRDVGFFNQYELLRVRISHVLKNLTEHIPPTFLTSPTEHLIFHIVSMTEHYFPRGTFELNESDFSLLKDLTGKGIFRLLMFVSPHDMTPEFRSLWIDFILNQSPTTFLEKLQTKDLHPDWFNSPFLGFLIPMLMLRKKSGLLTSENCAVPESELLSFYQNLHHMIHKNYIKGYELFDTLKRLRYEDKEWTTLDALYFYAEMVRDNHTQSWKQLIPKHYTRHDKNLEYWSQKLFNMNTDLLFQFMSNKDACIILTELGNPVVDIEETQLLL